MSGHRPSTAAGRFKATRRPSTKAPQPRSGWSANMQTQGSSGKVARKRPKSRNPNCMIAYPWVAIVLEWESQRLNGTLNPDVVRTTDDDDAILACAKYQYARRNGNHV